MLCMVMARSTGSGWLISCLLDVCFLLGVRNSFKTASDGGDVAASAPFWSIWPSMSCRGFVGCLPNKSMTTPFFQGIWNYFPISYPSRCLSTSAFWKTVAELVQGQASLNGHASIVCPNVLFWGQTMGFQSYATFNNFNSASDMDSYFWR